MATTSPYYQYHTTGTLPVNVPGKQPQQLYARGHTRTPSNYSQYSVSPPEHPESVSAISSGGLYSSASSQYGGSDYESSASTGATSVDLLDYMNDRLSQTCDPIAMDRTLVKQAQTSGELNAKNRELLELQAKARARLAATRAKFSDGMAAARDVQRDLAYTQKKIQTLNARAAAKYPEQYQAARELYAPQDEY